MAERHAEGRSAARPAQDAALIALEPILEGRLPQERHEVLYWELWEPDNTASRHGMQALRIAKSATGDHYWAGYRREYAGLNTLEKGAYLLWERGVGNPARATMPPPSPVQVWAEVAEK